MKKPLDGWLLASDIDNTLLFKGKIIDRNIEAIARFVSLGGKMTIASGRSIEATVGIAKIAGANCPVITSNGAIIYDFHNNKVLRSASLPEESKPFAWQILERYDKLGALAYTEKGVVLIKENKTMRDLIEYEGLKIIDTDKQPVIPWSKIIFGAEPDYIDIVEKECNTSVYGAFIRSMDRFYEIMPFGVNKGEALLILADMLKIDKDKTCAVGDYYNDVEFISCASIGSYVKNAPEELKRKADFVGGSCQDGGVADFIDYIISLASK